MSGRECCYLMQQTYDVMPAAVLMLLQLVDSNSMPVMQHNVRDSP